MTIPLIKNEANVLMSDNGLIVNYFTEYGMPMLKAQGLALKKEKILNHTIHIVSL